jgi:hypothetical protein
VLSQVFQSFQITLETLAFKNTELLCPYSLITASVLDYIQSMSLEEVRKVMDILARLAFSRNASASGELFLIPSLIKVILPT